MDHETLPVLRELLKPEYPQHLYALIDAAAHTHIHAHIEAWQPPAIALEAKGFGLPPEAAPWLVHLKAGNTFSDWFLQEGLLAGWGIVLHSEHKLLVLADQLNPWLAARHSETGQALLVRFYDPQITYAYLSLLNAGDQASLLNGISRLWRAIGGDGLLEQLDMGQDNIQRQRIDLNEALAIESTGESDATV
jgi:hypothetical protein